MEREAHSQRELQTHQERQKQQEQQEQQEEQEPERQHHWEQQSKSGKSSESIQTASLYYRLGALLVRCARSPAIQEWEQYHSRSCAGYF